MLVKILSRSRGRRIKNTEPRVCLPKLEATTYQSEQSSTQSTSHACQKEEFPCFFNSEVELCDDENNVRVEERNLACQCESCSALYDLKNQIRENFLAQQERNSPAPLINEFLYDAEVDRILPPQPVCATNAGTQTETKVYRIKCKDCGSEFNDEYFFQHHRRVHVKMLECAFCDAQFFKEKSLEKHILLHLREPVYECIYCPAVYCKKRFLNDHLKIHEKCLFSCRTCSAKFDSKARLQLHQKTHSSSGSLIHVFRKLRSGAVPPNDADDNLESVVSVPIQQRPRMGKSDDGFFECKKCDLQFKNCVNLKRHDAIHKRKAHRYLHFCTTCNARFRQHGHLQIHLKAAHKKSKGF